ncbi:MAG: hypothetical protein ACFFDN_45145 [Candidatus Hodarchaeota archaeon]
MGFIFLHELGHVIAAILIGDTVILSLNSTEFKFPVFAHYSLTFYMAGPLITLFLSILGYFVYLKINKYEDFFLAMSIFNALNRLVPVSYYYLFQIFGVVKRQDELYAGLLLAYGKTDMNFWDVSIASNLPNISYLINPLYHIFAVLVLIFSIFILFKISIKIKSPYDQNRRVILIFFILSSIISVLLSLSLDYIL